MGVIFTLDPAIRELAETLLGDMIIELGKNILLVYPPKIVSDPTVTVDSIGNKPGNKWINGGRGPLDGMSNTVFKNASGTDVEEYTETIIGIVETDPLKFWNKVDIAQVSAGTIQVKTYIENLHKILQAKELILMPELVGSRWRYVLDGEPTSPGSIVQKKFIVSQWKRAG